MVAAISSAAVKKAYPFLVLLAQGEAGLSKAGFVNCSQLVTIDQGRLLQLIGKLEAFKMSEVDKALAYELGLAPL